MKRTTIEIDEKLLDRARRALGKTTARATVEEALKRAADGTDADRAQAAKRERRFFDQLASRVDTRVLLSEEMWR